MLPAFRVLLHSITQLHCWVGIAVCILLAGCSSSGPKKFSTHTTSPKKATSRPYKIKGKMYYPQHHYEYSEVGIASWYGKRDGFHGRKTATGEVFNTHKLTAAHKTLPLPSVVRVTNLENGRSLIVKVNDRGPFKPGRIIDVSEKVAQLLGLYRKGTARVRVDCLVRESLAMNNSPGKNLPVRYAAASNVPVRAPFRQAKSNKKKRKRRTIIPPRLSVPTAPVLASGSAVPKVVSHAKRSRVAPASRLSPVETGAVTPNAPVPSERPSWLAFDELTHASDMSVAGSDIPIPKMRPGGLDPQELSALKQDLKEVIRVVVPDIPEKKLGAIAKKLLDGVY